MGTYDISPLYRSTVGFDRLFDMLDQTARVEPMTNWPPYNIEQTGEDQYRITMARGGLSPDEIEFVQQESKLLVAGNKHSEPAATQYLHRGIATRSFRQTFNLAQHVKVKRREPRARAPDDDLKREVPEALKPRRIEIATASGPASVAQNNVTTLEQPKVA